MTDLSQLVFLAERHEAKGERKTYIAGWEFIALLDNGARKIYLNLKQDGSFAHEIEYGGHVFVTTTGSEIVRSKIKTEFLESA